MVFYQNDANGIANSENPIRLLLKDQSNLGLHCLSKNLGSLRYDIKKNIVMTKNAYTMHLNFPPSDYSFPNFSGSSPKSDVSQDCY